MSELKTLQDKLCDEGLTKDEYLRYLSLMVDTFPEDVIHGSVLVSIGSEDAVMDAVGTPDVLHEVGLRVLQFSQKDK